METLTTDVGPQHYRVVGLHLEWERSLIGIWVRTPAGTVEKFVYNGPTALAMMRTLNKADLRSNTLHRRILERLAQDGKLPTAGVVTGQPD